MTSAVQRHCSSYLARGSQFSHNSSFVNCHRNELLPSLRGRLSFARQYASINSGIAHGIRSEAAVFRSRRRHDNPTTPTITSKSKQSYERSPVKRRSQPESFRNSRDSAPGHSYNNALHERIAYATAASQFLAGSRAVTAALKAGRRQIHRLYIAAESGDVQDICQLARLNGVRIQNVSEEAISQRLAGISGMTRSPHENVMLDCSPIPEMPVKHLCPVTAAQEDFAVAVAHPATQHTSRVTDDTAEQRLPSKGQGQRHPVIIWAHQVTDTGNLGALCRTALYFGAAAVLVTARGSSAVTPATIRAGAGAPEFVPLLRVYDPSAFIKASQDNGWRFLAAVAPSQRSKVIDPVDMHLNPALDGPCVMILGNEEVGLPARIVQQADNLICIPSRSQDVTDSGVDSLNVSVAGAVLAERLTRPLSADERLHVEARQKERLF